MHEDIKANTCIWKYKLNNNVFEYSEEQQKFLYVTFGKVTRYV